MDGSPGEIGGIPIAYIAFGCVALTMFIFLSVTASTPLCIHRIA